MQQPTSSGSSRKAHAAAEKLMQQPKNSCSSEEAQAACTGSTIYCTGFI